MVVDNEVANDKMWIEDAECADTFCKEESTVSMMKWIGLAVIGQI